MFKGVFTIEWILFAVILNSVRMSALAEEKEIISSAVEGCSKFASNFHKIISRNTKGENIVNSPLSVHPALSYLFHGAAKHTAREIMTGLCLSETGNLHSEYLDIINHLNGFDTIEVRLANAIFLQENVTLHKTFQTKGIEFYNFSVQNVDFADIAGSTKTINSWVSENTEGKIKDIISPGDINDFTKVILLNAIYFKGQWLSQFKPELTEMRKFHLNEKTSKKIPTMYRKGNYAHGEIPHLKSRFIEIPYKDARIDMIIILPNEISGLQFVEGNFDWKIIANAEASSRGSTELYLPKFKIEATLDLKNVLTELGFVSMFEDTADFSEMSDVQLKVDSVIQKAFIEVNEFGTEAAAATAVRMMMKRSLKRQEESDEFIVDRPFVVAVREVTHNIPLFLGSVRDIIATSEKDEL